MDQQEILANFMAITAADDAAALQCLEATNWSLEEACSLYFASHDGQGASNGGAGGAGAGDDFPDIPPEVEHEVRAPLPTKVERLYGATTDPRMLAAASAAQYGLNQQRHTAPPVDVFRDFKAEGKEAQGQGSTSGLSSLFKPPKDLLFQGTFDMAKMRSQQEGKWLMLNINANDEFDSHRLNRDTWSHEALKEMLKGMFLFYQVYENQPEGRVLCSMYKAQRLPVIMVVDPITGASLYTREGFVGAEKLIEDLIPFMDHGPTDPGAGQMAQAMSLKRKTLESAATTHRIDPAAMAEEDQMALALAMSMSRDQGAGTGEVGTSQQQPLEDMDDVEEAAMWAEIRKREEEEKRKAEAKSPEQVRQEAAARLPAEPPESSATSCRVALRLPDGSRVQRRFDKSDAVQAIIDFCFTVSDDAASGKPFDLTPTLPGAQPLSDPSQTLQDAGVANAMLAVKFRS